MMRKPAFLVVFVLVLVLGLQVAKAEAPYVFPDIQRILDAGVLKVAILNKEEPPLIMKSDTSLTGTEPDLARELANNLGVDVEFILDATTYDEVVDLVARKEADIAVSYLTGSVQRGLYVLFSRPYIRQTVCLFYNRTAFARLKRDHDMMDLDDVNHLPEAGELVVGFEKGTVNHAILKRDFPRFKLQAFDSLKDIVPAVKNGEIFAGMHGSLRTGFYMRRHPATAIHVAIDSKHHLPSDIRIAVRSDAPNLLRWIDLYLANRVGMQKNEEIIEKYLAD